MDTISKAKKLQAMYSYKTRFLYNLVFHLLLALTCRILCPYPFWFPSLCSSMKQLLFSSLPNKSSSSSSFFSPTCLFIVVNVIVVFLVGESKLGGSNRSPAGEIYDEYVERSRSLRRVSTVQEQTEDGKKTELTELIEERVISTSSNVNQGKEVKEEVKNIIELSKEEAYKEVEEKGKEGGEGEEEESGLPGEELNRRVEEFIARVNKQRLLEAW